tara:strand:+ start:196 stop:441 length:246 start_codon:yes stop_codon:yes gene_type:complete
MDEEKIIFHVGDVVQESPDIVPPDRKVWTGIVVLIQKDHFNLFSELGPFEDMVSVHWFQSKYVESLPASVIRLVQKAKENT